MTKYKLTAAETILSATRQKQRRVMKQIVSVQRHDNVAAAGIAESRASTRPGLSAGSLKLAVQCVLAKVAFRHRTLPRGTAEIELGYTSIHTACDIARPMPLKSS
jgi:hypothetical protein